MVALIGGDGGRHSLVDSNAGSKLVRGILNGTLARGSGVLDAPPGPGPGPDLRRFLPGLVAARMAGPQASVRAQQAEIPQDDSIHAIGSPPRGESEATQAEALAFREAFSEAGWRSLLGEYPWPLDEALLVIYGPTSANAQAPRGCPTGESNGDPLAYNPSGSYGVMQIQWYWHRDKLRAVAGSDDPALLFDPAINIAVGWLVYSESGGGSWLPWSCRP